MIRTWLSTAVAVLGVAGSNGAARADGPAPDWNAVPATTPLSVKPPVGSSVGSPAEPAQWVPAAPPPSVAQPAPVVAPKPPAATTDAPEFRPILVSPAPVPAPVVAPTRSPSVPVSAPLPTPEPEFRAITPMPAPVPGPAPIPAPAPVAMTPAVPQSLPPAVPTELPPIPAAPAQLLPSRLPSLAVPPMSADPEPPKAGSKSEPLPPPRPAPSTPPEPGKVPLTPVPQTLVVNPAAGTPVVDTRPALDPAPNLPGTLNGVPVRGKVFGSPPVRLSRDFAARDFLGYDMADATPRESRLAGLFGGGSGGPPTDNYFVEAEYLLWWGNRPRIPLLATTSTGTGQGFVGQPGTVNLLGPGTFGPSLRDGLRVRAGGWLDDCSGHGFDASYFFLGRRDESVTFSGLPTLTRPFFAPNFNGEFGEVVALPNLSTGSLEVKADSFLWGADINYRCAVCRTCDRTSAWFAGYRHLNLAETLALTEDITATGPLATDPVGTRVVVGDRFRTHNRFHGGQVGYLIEQRYGRWEVGLRASVALGVTVQTLEIDGFQQRTRPGQATQFFNGGLLATGPNLGRFDSTRFSAVPEATVSLGYFVTPNVQLTFGYNFLYWHNVIRPGDQIDRTVDVSLVPNPPAGVQPSGQNRPLPTFTQSDFWAQGISFGVRYRW